jgi:hypothetical protein
MIGLGIAAAAALAFGTALAEENKVAKDPGAESMAADKAETIKADAATRAEKTSSAGAASGEPVQHQEANRDRDEDFINHVWTDP